MSLLSSDVKGSLSTMKLSFYIKIWRCSRSLTQMHCDLWLIKETLHAWRLPWRVIQIPCYTVDLACYTYCSVCTQFFFTWPFIHTYFNKVHLVCLEGESSVQYVYWYCDSIFRAIFNPILNGFGWSCNFLHSRVKKTKTKQQHIFAARTIRHLDNLLSSIQIK